MGKVYPRVKVRQQKEEDDQYAYESLPSLKVFESLSLSDVSSSGIPYLVSIRKGRVIAKRFLWRLPAIISNRVIFVGIFLWRTTM